MIPVSSTYKLLFKMLLLSGDPAFGVSPSIMLSKAGGTLLTSISQVSEVGAGWYVVALTSTETNTVGDLLVSANAPGCQPSDTVMQVVSKHKGSWSE